MRRIVVLSQEASIGASPSEFDTEPKNKKTQA